MTAVFTLATENGTNGADATEALTGYTAMTQTAPKYDNGWSIAGTRSLKSTLSGTSSLNRADFTGGASRYGRKYMKITNLPSASTAFWATYDSAHVHLGDVRMLTDGTVQLRNAGSSSLQTSSHAFAAGDEFRVEYNCNVAGTSTVRLFWGGNLHGTTADETLSGTNGTAGTGLVAQWTDGAVSGVTWTVAWDETVIDDTTWVGPVGGGSGSPFPMSGTSVAVVDTQGAMNVPESLASSRVRIWIGDEVVAAKPADVLTNGGRWSWGGSSYASPGTTFTAEAGGMRIYWGTPVTNSGATELGMFNMAPASLVSGHEIKIKVVVNVPVGSPDVRLANAFGKYSKYLTVKGKDAELYIRVPWDVASNTGVGIESAAGATTGSVLVKSVKIIDLTDNAGHWAPQLTLPSVDDTPPSTPGQPAATITNDSVALTWTASTDDVAVVAYELHRSTTTGFTPSGATLIATIPSNGYTDSGLANATYYYKAIARDAAGNVSAASTQRSVTISYTPPSGGRTFWTGVSTQSGLGGRLDWEGYRTYDEGRNNMFANGTGDASGTTQPKYLCYSKYGNTVNKAYSTYFDEVTADLNTFYYTGGAGSQTHSSRWNIVLYWMVGNENYKAGEITNVANYTTVMRAQYDAIMQNDPTTGQRRFPNARSASNPTHFQEDDGIVEQFLHPTARYHHCVVWSMYPPGRNFTITDPRYDLPGFVDANYASDPEGYMLRTFRRTKLAQDQARIDTGNNNFKITIACGEIGIPSDPSDNTTRPYYLMRGLLKPARLLGIQYGLTVDFMTYWDKMVANPPGPHNILSDEGSASDHGGTGTPSPNSAAVWRNYDLYDPSIGGTLPGSWSTNPKGTWNTTGSWA